MEYLDFELDVSAGTDGQHVVSVLRSPAGEARENVTLPFDGPALRDRLRSLQLALLRSGGKRRGSKTYPEDAEVEQFGRELFDSLFSGQTLARFGTTRVMARKQHAGIRLKVRFASAELAGLPWEYMLDPHTQDYLALSIATPLVRYIPLPEASEPLEVEPPLRVLGMVSAPIDLPELDAERERQRIETGLAPLIERGIIDLHWVPGQTWRDLRRELNKGPWHVLHFVGHGSFDAVAREGVLVLANDRGRSAPIGARDLGRLLGDHQPLRLTILNACESGRSDELDIFSSTAAVLVRRGTPAVVAMQYEITDDAAIELSRAFYEALADGLPVDSALSEARLAVALALPGTFEWGTPVLFMRASDGYLFRMPEAREPGAGLPEEAVVVKVPEDAEDAVEEPAEIEPQVIGIEEPPIGDRLPPTQEPPPTRSEPGPQSEPEPVLPPAPRPDPGRGRRRRSRVGVLAIAAVAAVLLLVGSLILMQPRPTLALSHGEATAGDSVTVFGKGFRPREFVQISIGSTELATVLTGSDGSFEATITVPEDLASTEAVTALGQASALTAASDLAVAEAPETASAPASPSESVEASASLLSPSVQPSDAVTSVTPPPPTHQPTLAPTLAPTPIPTPIPTPVPTVSCEGELLTDIGKGLDVSQPTYMATASFCLTTLNLYLATLATGEAYLKLDGTVIYTVDLANFDSIGSEGAGSGERVDTLGPVGTSAGQTLELDLSQCSDCDSLSIYFEGSLR